MKYSTKIMIAFSLGLATVGMSVPLSMARAEEPAPMMTEANNEEPAVFDQVDAYVEAWQLEDAIALLEGVASEGSELPAVYHKLGDLYQQAGYDSEKAAKGYAAALHFAQESEDLKAAADAQVALARIASNHGQIETAKELLMQAQSNYEAVGKAEQAGAVQEQMALLPEDSSSTSEMPTMRGGNDSEPDIREMITPKGGDFGPPIW